MRSFQSKHIVKRPSYLSRLTLEEKDGEHSAAESPEVVQCSLPVQEECELNALRDAYLHLQETVTRLEMERNRYKEEVEISHQQNLVLKEASEHLKREYDGFRTEFDRYVAENKKKIDAYYRMKRLMQNLVGIHGERIFRQDALKYREKIANILEKLP